MALHLLSLSWPLSEMIARRPSQDLGPVENDGLFFFFAPDFLSRTQWMESNQDGRTAGRSHTASVVNRGGGNIGLIRLHENECKCFYFENHIND